MDAVAVSVATGLALAKVTPRHVFRMSFHFGLFQFLMPILGWFVGEELSGYIGAWAPWAALVLLGYVGGKMLWEAFHHEDDSADRADPTRGWQLVSLSVATSLDALMVGLSLAFLHVRIWIPAVVIGIVTATLSALGITFGSRVGARWGRMAEIAGGVLLLLIGLRSILVHYLG